MPASQGHYEDQQVLRLPSLLALCSTLSLHTCPVSPLLNTFHLHFLLPPGTHSTALVTVSAMYSLDSRPRSAATLPSLGAPVALVVLPPCPVPGGPWLSSACFLGRYTHLHLPLQLADDQVQKSLGLLPLPRADSHSQWSAAQSPCPPRQRPRLNSLCS